MMDMQVVRRTAQLTPPTDNNPDGAVAKPEEKKKTEIGKPLKPVTLAEEFNDSIDF